MAQYTLLSSKELVAILSNYNLSSVTKFEILSGGSENTNYRIDTAKHSYVLSICEQKTFQRTEDLARLLLYLENMGFESSRVVLDNDDSPITIWNGKPIILKHFIQGHIQHQLTLDLLELSGRQLGKLHKIKAPDYLPTQLDYGKESFYRIREYAAGSEMENWLTMILEYITPYLSNPLPKVLIHSDVFCDNIIINKAKDKVVIMDFEEAAYYYRIFDIGMMIIGTCRDGDVIDLDKASALLKGYQKEIQLKQLEIEALKAFTVYAGASMTFWRHINFNHFKPDPAMAEHYLGLKVLTDYVLGLEDDCFNML